MSPLNWLRHALLTAGLAGAGRWAWITRDVLGVLRHLVGR